MNHVTVNKPVPLMLTIKELAEKTGISGYCIRKWCMTNEIKYIKSGTKHLINYDLFIDYLNGKPYRPI